MKKYKKAEIDEALTRDLIPQQLIHYLLGRRVAERLSDLGLLPKIISGHRVAQYSTARFNELREKLRLGLVTLDFNKPKARKQN